MKKMASSILLVSFLSTGVFAQDEHKGHHKEHHKKPPKIALELCKDKAPGDPCDFKDKDGAKGEGVCVQPEKAPVPFCAPKK